MSVFFFGINFYLCCKHSVDWNVLFWFWFRQYNRSTRKFLFLIKRHWNKTANQSITGYWRMLLCSLVYRNFYLLVNAITMISITLDKRTQVQYLNCAKRLMWFNILSPDKFFCLEPFSHTWIMIYAYSLSQR